MQNEIQEGLKLVALLFFLIPVIILYFSNKKISEKQGKALIIGITVILFFSIILCVYIFLKNNNLL